MVMPAVVVVAALLTGGLGAGIALHRLHHHASDHARVVGLGGDASLLPGHSDSASFWLSYADDLVCVHYRDRYDAGWWALSPLELSTHACALNPVPHNAQ